MALSSMLLARDNSPDQSDSSMTPVMSITIISILAFVVLICSGITAYIILRRRNQSPPPCLLPTHSTSRHHRHPSISTSFDRARHSSVYVFDEKHNLMANTSTTAGARGSVPEIRITFPDEEGTSERAKGGRVVIVKVGDSGTVGMEPMQQESLPLYSSSTDGRFQSLDLNRMGGLSDAKDVPGRWS